MGNLFERLLGHGPTSSAETAKKRLQLVLIHDRTNISPEVMEKLKDELITVISRHVNIDRESVEINLTQDQRENRLVANIPLLANPGGGRRRRRQP
jgi:cell division topological specificity factor